MPGVRPSLLVRPGRRGICGVRENRDGRLVSLAYGAVVAIGSTRSRRSRCSTWRRARRRTRSRRRAARSIARSARTGRSPRVPGSGSTASPALSPAGRSRRPSVTAPVGGLTYVEPTVFLEYALDTGRLARRAGLRNLFITDGYATPEAVGLLAPILDAANVDLKSFDDAFYRKVCGGRLAAVLNSIVAMREAGIWLEVTTLIIPGRNDDVSELRALTRWVVETLGPGDAVARQPVLPRLPHARRRADTAGDAPPAPPTSVARRIRPCLRRERPGARPRGHSPARGAVAG